MSRLLRILLKLLPREFQHAYARDLEATVRAEEREPRSRIERLRFRWATILDVLRMAPAQHWDVLKRDLKFAWRAMASRPVHTGTAVLTLALGLGVNVAIFAVLDAVWLQPLPYRQPQELVTIREASERSAPSNMGYLTFVDLRAQSRTVAAMAAAGQSIATITGDGRDADRITIMRASANYFDLVGVAPALGRRFTEAEDRPGPARRFLILSDGLWRRRFGGDPDVIQRVVQLNGLPFTIVGVMPRGFEDLVAQRLYQGAEAWTPLGYDPAASYACRTCRHLRVFGRLAPGRAIEDAERELNGIVAAAARAHPSEYNDPSIRVDPLSETFIGPVRQTLIVLAIAAGLLLAVACGNVANLLLLRSTERTHEVAVRTALGVTTSRLARQLLTESVLLAVVGGLAGLPLAYAGIKFFVSLAPAQLPRLAEASLDVRAMGAAFGLMVICGVVFGLVPLLQLRKRAGVAGLHGAGRRTAGAGTWRVRATLVAANVAMAALLLVSSGLLGRSLLGLLAVDTGFDARDVVTMKLTPAGQRFATPDDPAANIANADRFYREVLERVRALPGVDAAAGVTTLPLSGSIDGYGLHLPSRPLANPETAPFAHRFVVTSDFFQTLKMKLVHGRLLDDRDRQTAPRSVVVNATLAREMFHGKDAIGEQLKLGATNAPPWTIVGVVEDIRHVGLDMPPGYQAFVPQAQWQWAETDLTLLVRTKRDPADIFAAVRAAVNSVDPMQPVTTLSSYAQILDAVTSTRRVAVLLVGIFGIASFALAIVGLAGALSVTAAQRSQEISVRMALGAGAPDIRRLIMGQGLRPAIAGLVVGLAASAASVGVLGSLLYGVGAFDPATLVTAGGTLLVAAAITCAVPAWRAARANPAAALRMN